MAEERDPRTVWAGSERVAFGSSPRERDVRATLLALAERAPAEADVDRYGGGTLAERLEARVADLLGKEAAVWMPSGTMAQQIALRIHARRRGLDAIAFHPHCHLDTHEERGYEWLHGLHAVHVADRTRLVTAEDVAGLREPVAALLLELPQRDLGGRLPDWDDLAETCKAARDRGAAVHLDGARLWQCGPFYDRPLHEIAALFDSVYVSFYKDLGAPAGCALAGTRALVDEARVWQIRHGGRLFTAYPYLLAAERGLDEVLPRMPDYVERARELATALASLDDVRVLPDPPQTAMFHVRVARPLDAFRTAAFDLAEETGVWIGANVQATDDPTVQAAELTVGEASFAVAVDEVRALWADALSRSEAA
ncbi:MAG TPA: beta-eliminating lyase-related protein [Gaiellaceae bacterium]|nr:beta-eliminating lyase-related protein [Gaiellaceae bacterium]